MENVSTLINLFASLMLINILINFILYKSYKIELYKISSILWIMYTVNFLSQGLLDSNKYLMVWGFCTYFPVSLIFRRILSSSIKNESFSNTSYYVLFVLSLVAFNILYFLDLEFMLYSMPVAFAISLPMTNASFKVLLSSEKTSVSVKILCYFLLLTGLHLIDYPFLRNSEYASLGFSIMFILVFTLSCVLPTFVFSQNSKVNISDLELILKGQMVQIENAKKFLSDTLNKDETSNEKEEKEWKAKVYKLLHDANGALQVIIFASTKLKKIVGESEEVTKQFEKLNTKVQSISEITSELKNVVKSEGSEKHKYETIHSEKIIEILDKKLEECLKFKMSSVIYDFKVVVIRVCVSENFFVEQLLKNFLLVALKASFEKSLINLEIKEFEEGYKVRLRYKGEEICQDDLHYLVTVICVNKLNSKIFSIYGEEESELSFQFDKPTSFIENS